MFGCLRKTATVLSLSLFPFLICSLKSKHWFTCRAKACARAQLPLNSSFSCSAVLCCCHRYRHPIRLFFGLNEITCVFFGTYWQLYIHLLCVWFDATWLPCLWVSQSRKYLSLSLSLSDSILEHCIRGFYSISKPTKQFEYHPAHSQINQKYFAFGIFISSRERDQIKLVEWKRKFSKFRNPAMARRECEKELGNGFGRCGINTIGMSIRKNSHC